MVKQDGSLSQTNTHTVLKWTRSGAVHPQRGAFVSWAKSERGR